MAAYLSPIFGAGHQFFDNQGVILAGGKIWTYLAGTTTLQGTWTDSTQVTSNANPIILDSTGRTTTEIWLQASTLYKYIVTDSDDNQIGIAWDNIAGLNDITSSVTVSEWSATSLTPTYISATSFSVPGNNTATFTVNRRIQAVVSAGTIYGYVYSSTFSTVTTVVIVPDSTSLDSGLSSVSVGLLDSTNVSVPNQYKIGIPQNSQSAAYTTVYDDANKHILHPSSDDNPRTFTIDSNANVAYAIGTTITFVNEINTVTIAITSDTLTLASLGSTGSRTLSANSIATALKTGTTAWIISGVGLS